MTNTPLWTATDIAKACNGTCTGMWQATGFCFDSRNVKPGDIFIALKSNDFPKLRATKDADGHNYVSQALDNGAAGVIVERVPTALAGDPRIVHVASTREALIALGNAARARTGATVFGITGSVGKTSTREMMSLCLAAFGTTHASSENHNNIMGVPFTLANTPINTDYAVIEMGMDSPGEMTELSHIAKPHIAIITTVTPAHLSNFDNGIDGIADAKSEIFAGLVPGGIAIINRDMDTYARVYTNAQTAGVKTILSFGTHSDADARVLDCTEGRNGTRVRAKVCGTDVQYFIPAGKHQAINALAVLLAVHAAGLNVQRAADQLKNFAPVQGRGQEEHLNIGNPENPVILIDESYNASPAAMNAAFRVVAMIDPGRGGRRIAILGDMLELGATAPQLHADLALPIRAAGIDLVYTCGTLMKNLYDALPANNRGVHKSTSAELAQIVPDVLVPGDVVMVKGSKSSRMDLVVEALRAMPSNLSAKTSNETEQDRHAL